MKLSMLAMVVILGALLTGCATPAATLTLGVATPTYDLACGCETEKGEVTSGGWVPGAGDAKITFGLVAHVNPHGTDGNIQVSDQGTGQSYHGWVTRITRNGNTLKITGGLDDGGGFVAVVTDNGEPGRNDRFGFSANGQVVVPVGTVLGDGNVQIHSLH